MKGYWRYSPVLLLCLVVAVCGKSDPAQPDRIDSVTLVWEAPAASADGSPVDDLAGYRVLYGRTSPLAPENSVSRDVGIVTTWTVRDLEPGVYYFTVLAIDTRGNVSEPAVEVSVELPER
ncbi:MAG: fibronectin type III domain-containing protein [Gemmatimonadota bacterium]|nr:MAG: fibronectin type III domain-containing protein [Gemmatimonadota bacterium]